MRTVFVNPSRVRRRRKSRPASSHRRSSRRRYSRKRRRSNPSLIQNPRRRRYRRRNAGITSFVSNPRRRRRSNPSLSLRSVPSILRDTFTVALGATGGAGLNRVGLSHITNFWMRNGARVLAAAGLVGFGRNSPMACAAAGAVLAPIVPEVEMQMASVAKNPQELAAELAGLLDGGGLSESLDDDPNLAADLSDLQSW